MNKRFVSVALALAMILGTVSCGSAQEDIIGKDALAGINFNEDPVTITYLTIGDKPDNGRTEEVIEKLNKILRKRVNAELDIYYVAWDHYLSNYDKALSTEDLGIDLVGTGADWLDAWPNVINGNFMPLSEEMLKTYCGRTYENISAEEWEDCKYGDDIYLIPENEYTQWTNHGFVYREDFAQEAGLESVESWDDLTKYLYSVKEKHPEITPWDSDGKNTIATLGYLMSEEKYIPIYELTTYGLWGAYSDDLTKIVSPYYTGNELVEYAKLMKEWDQKGVWRQDLTLAGDNTSEYYSGISGTVQHHTQNYYTIIRPNMSMSQPEVESKFFWFGKESGNLVRTSILHGAMAVSAYSDNPERALMVYDLLRNDEECYRLITKGIEGVQYSISSNGMVEKPGGYNQSDDDIVTNFWWGRRDEYELQDVEYSWEQYYQLVDTYEDIAVDYPWDGVPFSTPLINAELENIVEVCDKYIPEIAYGKYEVTAEEEVAAFREALQSAGFERVTRQLQMILDEE